MVYAAEWGSHYATILVKYLVQAVRTLKLLIRERPTVVFVMTPPVAACIPVFLYTKLSGGQFIIDAHSGAFLQHPWKRLLFLHRFFSRRARTTIVTNSYLRNMIESWGASAAIVSDVPVQFPSPTPIRVQGTNRMAFVCTFQPDEPVAELFEAARLVPEVQFYVTGDSGKVAREIRDRLPGNVHLTGFIPDGQYRALLESSDAVIALTTLEHTMQRAAYEAVYLGKPVIVSDTLLLRREFSRGAVHVHNAAGDIARGVREMLERLATYTREAQHLRELKLTVWQETLRNLRTLVASDATEACL